MKWDRRVRRYWDFGDQTIFTLSKDKCHKFVHALVACDGQIHDSYSHGFTWCEGQQEPGMKLHQIDVLFRISLPVGAEDKFEEIIGHKCLSEPPQIVLN